MRQIIASLVFLYTVAQEKTPPPLPAKQPCIEFTIIKHGKGVNCDGDTIPIYKVYPGYWSIRKE